MTKLPDQEFPQGSKGSAIQPDPLPPREARRYDKEGTDCQPTKSIFHSPALLTNSYFYSSCDQDSLRKMLLITAKAVFMKVHQKQLQTNK